MRASAAVALLLCFFGIVILTIVLYRTAFDNEVLEEPKPALEYDLAEAATSDNPDAILNEKTGVLGFTVYGSDNAVLGTLYDVYVSPETGEIKWVSVNVEETKTSEADREAELILISTGELAEFSDEGPIVIGSTPEQFFNLPYQKKHEEKLENLVSLRALPESPVRDTGGKLMGAIDRVTFADNAINEVFFKAVQQGYAGREEEFSTEFSGLIIKVSNEQNIRNTEVILTDRQAGAVEAYLKE